MPSPQQIRLRRLASREAFNWRIVEHVRCLPENWLTLWALKHLHHRACLSTMDYDHYAWEIGSEPTNTNYAFMRYGPLDD